jgi:hypothetical protein
MSVQIHQQRSAAAHVLLGNDPFYCSFEDSNRFVLQFSDILVYCNKGSSSQQQFKVHGVIPVQNIQIEEAEYNNSFSIYGACSMLFDVFHIYVIFARRRRSSFDVERQHFGGEGIVDERTGTSISASNQRFTRSDAIEESNYVEWVICGSVSILIRRDVIVRRFCGGIERKCGTDGGRVSKEQYTGARMLASQYFAFVETFNRRDGGIILNYRSSDDVEFKNVF